ncbi:hypothetical protein GCM10010504_20270 [Streptomyces griseus]|nr:hypothetical protein GCM10010504_20270 [Streptomyces griseus]
MAEVTGVACEPVVHAAVEYQAGTYTRRHHKAQGVPVSACRAVTVLGSGHRHCVTRQRYVPLAHIWMPRDGFGEGKVPPGRNVDRTHGPVCQVDRPRATDAHGPNPLPQRAGGQGAQHVVDRTEEYVGGFPSRGGAACTVNQNAILVDQGAGNFGSADIESGDQAIVREWKLRLSTTHSNAPLFGCVMCDSVSAPHHITV